MDGVADEISLSAHSFELALIDRAGTFAVSCFDGCCFLFAVGAYGLVSGLD
jgi:hypothetical protein